MKTSSVANRYARTLHAHALEEHVRDEVRADCRAIRRMIGSTPEFSSFVENPTIPPETASQVILRLFKDQADPVTLRFLLFLASRERLSLLGSICDVYEQLVCEDLGILKVTVTAAHDLSDTQLEALKEKLQVRYGRTIVADVKVDTSFIGGFRIQAGDRISDFSLRSRLDQFEQSVINAQHQHSKYKVKSWR